MLNQARLRLAEVEREYNTNRHYYGESSVAGSLVAAVVATESGEREGTTTGKMKKKVEYEITMKELLLPVMEKIDRIENAHFDKWTLIDRDKATNRDGSVNWDIVKVRFTGTKEVGDTIPGEQDRKLDLKL